MVPVPGFELGKKKMVMRRAGRKTNRAPVSYARTNFSDPVANEQAANVFSSDQRNGSENGHVDEEDKNRIFLWQEFYGLEFPVEKSSGFVIWVVWIVGPSYYGDVVLILFCIGFFDLVLQFPTFLQ